MRNNFKVLGSTGALVAFVALAQMSACTTDPAEDSTATGGTGGAADDNGGAGGVADSTTAAGGKTSTSSTGTTPAGNTICSKAVTLASATTLIASFDDYDGIVDLPNYSYTVGTTGVYSGPFVYGDDHVIDAAAGTSSPEEGGMVAGAEGTTYALRIYDSLAEQYGGGMGVWLADCFNASVFSGISFWVRGIAPTGSAKLSLPMEATTSALPKTVTSKIGTCPSTTNAETDCVAPSYSFPVTDVWTQIKVPWASFTAGSAMGTPVKVDGNSITQVQFDIGVKWVPDATDETKYVPEPAEYELVVDTIAFY